MSYVNPKAIIDVFNKLNAAGLDYILIRNINSELPSSLRIGKDIDLLVHYKDRRKFINFFVERGFKSIKHPHCDNIFLYGANKFEKFVNKDNVLLDLNYQLTCQSLNAGEWIPLDHKIQDSAWKNKKINKNDKVTYYSLGTEDEFVVLVTRSIFDKKEFQKGYIEKIDELINVIDVNDVIAKFQLIFFKFTSVLLSMLKKRQYEMILHQYISFSEY
jgi:hypothetical protein